MRNVGNAWPIVVGGCHRSGTSVVRRMLNAHSRIYCGPEVKFFRDWYGDYLAEDAVRHARFFTSARGMLPEGELLEILGRAFVDIHLRAAANAGKQRWADKNPENVLYLKEWERMLGDAWVFLHVVRNPLDTLASIAEADFRFAVPAGLEARIEHYRRYAEAGLAFQAAHPDRYYRIVYEKLVRSPADEVHRLMEWLGEKTEAAQLDFNSKEHQPGLEDPKISRTQGVHPASIGRWKAFFQKDEAGKIVSATVAVWEQMDIENVYPLPRGLDQAQTGPPRVE